MRTNTTAGAADTRDSSSSRRHYFSGSKYKDNIHGVPESRSITTTYHEHPPLKSNLKKSTNVGRDDHDRLREEKRKVSWPDSLGEDIAHVQEFEPSVSEDGELKGVRNSCLCAIQ